MRNGTFVVVCLAVAIVALAAISARRQLEALKSQGESLAAAPRWSPFAGSGSGLPSSRSDDTGLAGEVADAEPADA